MYDTLFEYIYIYIYIYICTIFNNRYAYLCNYVSRHSVTAVLSASSDCGENAAVGDQECVCMLVQFAF